MRQWVSFDFDNTLHDYRGAAAHATKAVLDEMAAASGLATEVLVPAYREILESDAKLAFVEPLSSFQFRARRFSRLLTRVRPNSGLSVIPSLVALYDTVLCQNLRPLPGSQEILQWCRASGISVVVITEGPEDAQRLTLERLGFLKLVDRLVAASSAGASKSEGKLYRVALDQLGSIRQPLYHVGDSVERDAIGALAAGLIPILVGTPDLGPELSTRVLVARDLFCVRQLLASRLQLSGFAR